jgi:hypothetical protein
MVIKGADGDESSTDSFCWEGDEDSLELNSNNAISFYLPLRASASFPSCCHTTVGVQPLCYISKSELTPSGDDIVLSPALSRALSQAISLENVGSTLRLVVVDTGTTGHMLPDRLAFISYKSIHNL